MSFVKLDANILTSSVWTEDSDTRIVWIYLLVTADPFGVVRATVPGIATQCGLAVEVVRQALDKFAAPDPDSRTSMNEGRRIRIEREPQFEIHVLNYANYREKDHTAAERKRRQRQRERKARSAEGVTRDSRDSHRGSQWVTQAEAEADRDKDKRLAAPDGAAGSSKRNGRRKGNPEIPLLVAHYTSEFARIKGKAPVVVHGAAEKAFQPLLAGRPLAEAKAIVTECLEHPPKWWADRCLADPVHVLKMANVVSGREAE